MHPAAPPAQTPPPARRHLPSSLLLLSRAFTVTQPLGRGPRAVDLAGLRETLSTLPDEAVEDVELFETAVG